MESVDPTPLSIDQIQHVFYINLAHRVDRRTHVEAQLASVGLPFERFEAIAMANGAVGCSLSHLKLLERAVKESWSHLLIVEDDITFLNPPLFRTQLDQCLKHIGDVPSTFGLTQGSDWDVILIAGNNVGPVQPVHSSCVQVSRCQTTTGYLVNGPYLATLADNVRAGVKALMKSPMYPQLYAIDQHWFQLQAKDKWLLVVPLTVTQLAGYSDIEKRRVNYTPAMTHLVKTRQRV